MYEDIYLYLLKTGELMRISEGTGDNLTEEDMEDGIVDYIYYDIYRTSSDLDAALIQEDGGMVLLREPFHEKYSSTEACIPDVLDFHFGEQPEYIILRNWGK